MPWKKELEEIIAGLDEREIIPITVHWQDGSKTERSPFVHELASVIQACIEEHGPHNSHCGVEKLSCIKIADFEIYRA